MAGELDEYTRLEETIVSPFHWRIAVLVIAFDLLLLAYIFLKTHRPDNFIILLGVSIAVIPALTIAIMNIEKCKFCNSRLKRKRDLYKSSKACVYVTISCSKCKKYHEFNYTPD